MVVGAAIIEDGQLLAAQRREPPELAGGWELPGGKVDPGERDEDALVRECREELGVEIAVGERIGTELFVPPSAVLRVWRAHLARGEPRAIEHAALRWVSADELDGLAWLRADLPLLPHLRRALAGAAAT